MRNYKIGFSFAGIIAVFLIMIPNILFLLITPPIDSLSSNEASFWFWNILENIGRFGTMISLCMITNKSDKRQNRVLDATSSVFAVTHIVITSSNFLF